MSLQFYPSSRHIVENVFKPACGEHCGILQSVIVRPIKYGEGLGILSFTGKMPNYHKVMLNINDPMQYHLGGYGTYYEEALIRLVGEAIERYSLMASFRALPKERIVYASHRELRSGAKVIPFEYMSLFSEEDYAKLGPTRFGGARPPTEDDVLGWAQCCSLFNPGEYIWVPLQMLFVGYRPMKGEIRFSPGFSTGTAAHKTLPKAMLSALLEFIEIDALMVHWYAKTKVRQVVVNDATLVEMHANILGPDSGFEVRVHDLSVLPDLRAHVMGTAIINKKDERPFMSYGAQGSLNPLKSFYRSFTEAMAIEYLGIFGPLYQAKEYFVDASNMTIADLDTNAGYWASPGNADTKKRFMDEFLSGEKKPLTALSNYETADDEADLTRLLSDLKRFSEYAVYLDVTPPEVRDQGWYVMRVFIPELVTMCVPGVPYSNHPRWSQFGGKKHAIPHPLP